MSKKLITTGTLDMLRSLYDFKATYARTLNFKENDYFILQQTSTKHKNWWEVMNERGEIGFVPSNYVEKIIVSPEFYLQFLDDCINYVRRNNSSPESAVDERQDLLQRLNEVRRNIKQIYEVEHVVDEGDSPPSLFKNSQEKSSTIENSVFKCNSVCFNKQSHECEDSIKLVQKNLESKENKSQEPVENYKNLENNENKFQESIDNSHKTYVKEELQKQILDVSFQNTSSTSSAVCKVSPIITHQSVYDLIESVRINTQLSHEMSQIALVTVVQGLHELLPASVFPYLSTILSYSQKSLKVDDVQIEQTHDASRLKIIFNELTFCKEDSQQRSWMLHEDESVIKEYLKELIQILTNADASISKHVVSSQQYHVITTLIQYYQMEARWSIRQLLLQAFGILCSLDKTVVSIMLNSVLPGELARDMIASPRNITKLNYSSLLLTMIMSMGESMPLSHYEYLGVSFVLFLLDNIECPPATDVDDQIPELFTNLIIAYNLQFTSENENIVLKALAEKSVTKIFIERLLLLFNREEDPVRIFDHKPKPPHSLLKLFLDIFSSKVTANLFYTNDILVLIDIIVRFITDLSTDDERQLQYLELCRRVMRNTYYEEHLHRRDEILKCFTRIFCEETEQSRHEQKLVTEIMDEFPQYFQ